MDKQTALEVFNGVMLGDAGMYQSRHWARYTYFVIGLSKGEMSALSCYLRYVKDALVSMGIQVSGDFPKVQKGMSKGKPYTHCRLSTWSSPQLAEMYPKWYKEDLKIVPTNVYLGPVTLAHWFMGDGSSRYGRSGNVYTSFATMGFPVDSISVLEEALHDLGLNTGRGYDRRIEKGDGITLFLLQDSVNKFMDIVRPYMMEPYMYKIKYRGDQRNTKWLLAE